ncbi:acyl--CoA ligase family protein (plasmid) [Thauera butanivorans]|uniref:acyl--CoA ligase family protein n=1 Tax=Thauera butanivorans TaxID=86174 RepID=UPI003AB1EC02
MSSDINFEPLTPVSFLRRSGRVHADRVAVIDEGRETTYAQLLERCERLAGGLNGLGVAPGDRVAVLLHNTQAMVEAHFGVPMAGAVLVSLNTRLSATEFAYILEHSGARILIHDVCFTSVVAEALAHLGSAAPRTVAAGGREADDEYEQLIASAPCHSVSITDERGMLALNYTSGTTGKPKGVMYHHRGAYLQSLAMALHTGLTSESRYLWTLPMFHCNGWCFPWAVTAVGGTHVCQRRVDPGEIWGALYTLGVTHMNAAPTVVSMLAWHKDAVPGKLQRKVRIGTGGAPPTPVLLARMGELGLDMMHLYGLTETFGPSLLCDWHPDWNGLPLDEQARLKARQGVGNVISETARVVDEHGQDVPADGRSMGEIALRGNNLMLGYYRDVEATRRACPDGWFRTGDVGVMYPDGYLELRDRSKDVIISGGENIASVEVEQAIATHPAVLESAVVAAPDEKWGEVPVAYVTLRDGETLSADVLAEHLRKRIARYKVPKYFVFGELPKTATGKIQKFALRSRARGQ